MTIISSNLNREMAVETLREASIGDQLLVFSETETNMYLVKGRSEPLAEDKINFKLLDLYTNKTIDLAVEPTDLDFNILGVFLSKRAYK